jgi:DNA-binding NarL/FixJ family response regulator
MKSRAPGHLSVLLVSVEPRVHDGVVRSFHRMGARVGIARSAPALLTGLRSRPDLVLVDLAFGAALTSAAVKALNAGRGPWAVVALHQGKIESTGTVAADLQVDGFCRSADLCAAFEQSKSAAFAAGAVIH